MCVCVQVDRNVYHISNRVDVSWTKTSLCSGLMPSGCVVPERCLCLDRSLITLTAPLEYFSQERGLCSDRPVTHGLVRELWPMVTRRAGWVGYLLLRMNTIGHSFQDDGGRQICHADHSTERSNVHTRPEQGDLWYRGRRRTKGCSFCQFFWWTLMVSFPIAEFISTKDQKIKAFWI